MFRLVMVAGTVLALAAGAAAALVPSARDAQRLDYRHIALRQQTADSVTVVVSWTAQNADAVLVAWENGVTRRLGTRGRDSVRVARPFTPKTLTAALTPLRGDRSGTVRTLSIALPVRPFPDPSIDSAAIDTTAAVSSVDSVRMVWTDAGGQPLSPAVIPLGDSALVAVRYFVRDGGVRLAADTTAFGVMAVPPGVRVVTRPFGIPRRDSAWVIVQPVEGGVPPSYGLDLRTGQLVRLSGA